MREYCPDVQRQRKIGIKSFMYTADFLVGLIGPIFVTLQGLRSLGLGNGELWNPVGGIKPV